MKTPITKETLLKFGMDLTGDPAVPMKKVIDTTGDEDVSIGVTRYRNTDEFALTIVGVGQIYLNITCIEDLRKVERLVSSFESYF